MVLCHSGLENRKIYTYLTGAYSKNSSKSIFFVVHKAICLLGFHSSYHHD